MGEGGDETLTQTLNAGVWLDIYCVTIPEFIASMILLLDLHSHGAGKLKCHPTCLRSGAVLASWWRRRWSLARPLITRASDN